MREIKFRGYDTSIKKWLYGNLVHYKEGFDMIYYQKDNETFMYGDVVDVKSIGQYTGIKDVNGNDVYEGDIIAIEVYENAFLSTFYKGADPLDFSLDECKGKQREAYETCIIFSDGEFIFGDSTGCATSLAVLWGDMRVSCPLFEIEVIGNVYEHPEFLTKGVMFENV